MDDLSQSLVQDNSKIKEIDEDESDEDDNNFEDRKHDLTVTQNASKLQEMRYENFLKVKKEFIAKLNKDKIECENKCESIKKLLLMTNSDTIDQFKNDFKNIDNEIEELYKQSEYLNV